MVAKGELLEKGGGWRCRDCGITVFGDPNDKASEPAKLRMCTSCTGRHNKGLATLAALTRKGR